MNLNQYRVSVSVVLKNEYESQGKEAKWVSIPQIQRFTVMPRVGDYIELGNPKIIDYIRQGLKVKKCNVFNQSLKVVAVIVQGCDENDEPLYDFSLLCVYDPLE